MARMHNLTCTQIFTLVLTVILLSLQSSEAARSSANRKVCGGTSLGFTYTKGSSRERYNAYVDHYANCTIVDTNLEIVHLSPPTGNDTYDMSFLESIEEVYGYVLIGYNFVDEIPLTNLRVIHGTTLFQDKSNAYSLFVSHNFKPNSDDMGLKELHLNSLHDISRGNVQVVGNNLLCHLNSIDWKDILANPDSKVHMEHPNISHCSEPCHNSCHQNFTGSSHCWGSGSENCQQFHRLTCSENCKGNCFGPGPRQCCHSECAGGCLGEKTTCWTCKNFVEDEECVAQCQPAFIYNPITLTRDPNPRVKYANRHQCVDKCDDHMYVREGACVRECGAGFSPPADGGNVCEPCGVHCPKVCVGGEVNSTTIHSYVNCTLIQGNLIFHSHQFSSDDKTNRSALALEDLQVFERVNEITGCLQIDKSYAELKSLSFLRNLRRIRGQTVCGPRKVALQIMLTQLETLGLTSLETVAKGDVFIAGNSNLTELGLLSLKTIADKIDIRQNRKLCYYKSINWTTVAGSHTEDGNGENTDFCSNENRTCSDQCLNGCWGAGDTQCVDCLSYRLEGQCLTSCDDLPGLFKVEQSDTKLCKRCHSECLDGCSGEGADQCTSCRHLKDGSNCTADCPVDKYPDANGLCQPCSQYCADGCTGPSSLLNATGCKACKRFIELENGDYGCGPASNFCPDGHFVYGMPAPTVTRSTRETKIVDVCRLCNEECIKCVYSGRDCIECKNYREGENCVSSCSDSHYPDPTSKLCIPCDDQCKGCRGPSNQDCLTCKNNKIYYSNIPPSELHTTYNRTQMDSNDLNKPDESASSKNISAQDERFICEELCPSWAPAKITEKRNNRTEHQCTTEAKAAASSNLLGAGSNKSLIAFGAIIGVLVVTSCSVMLVYGKVKRIKRDRERKTAELLGMRTLEESSPSSHKPDLSHLRLINESELSRGKTIGSGAFGTVYKGIWTPAGEKIKIPVAIKVLQKGPDVAELNTELLEEARIMASVRHENCIRILAVSLTAELMLITQLMPNGSLLDYIRKYRDRVGSNALLTWSKQIANGMKYLEQLGIVHRDLAARNVLVEGPQMVKITDFGLAKLVNDEDQYLAEGGKVPIKWLALESIQHRVFTHKSDVWSYGVTLWEIFTYGQRPYDTVPAKNLCDLLERGERLSQPPICTIDVYMIMIKCWMLDAQSRPSFKELVNTFSEFSSDPGRYLVIQEEDKTQFPTADQSLREMLRELSILEDDRNQVVTAEDYLRPHDLILDHLAMSNVTTDYTNLSETSGSPLLSPSDNSKFFEDHDLNRRGSSQQKTDLSRKYSQRYCPSPSREPLLSSTGSTSIRESQGPVEPLKPSGEYTQKDTERKVVDEEDYLKPQSSTKPSYIDIVPGCNPGTETEASKEAATLQSDYKNVSPNTEALENPEYYQFNGKNKVPA